MTIRYTLREERANYITHAVGLLMVVCACIFLIANYRGNGSFSVFVLGMLLYVFGAGASYLASSLYHSSASASVRREKLRKLDHAAIYWHIAGSYSPIVLSGMSEKQEWGWILFVIVWLFALVGSAVSFRGLKEHSNVETACFVLMGLVVLMAFDKVLYCVGWGCMAWIIAEGAAFIAGAIFYSLNKVPYMHTVFHAFVLAGTVCHLLALYCLFK